MSELLLTAKAELGSTVLSASPIADKLWLQKFWLHGVRLLAASLLACLVLWGLLALLNSIVMLAEQPVENVVIVREVSLAMPPPPPPAEMISSRAKPNSSQLEFGDLALKMPVQLPIENLAPKFDELRDKPPINKLTEVRWEIDWQPNWSAFSLAELDKKPRLLTPINVTFPNELKKRGINRAFAKLHVLIDMKGRVVLKSVREVDFPELLPALRLAIKQARFSPPEKDGHAVNAEFVWPLELKQS